MRVVITAEARFTRTPDGLVWSVGGAGYETWCRYLKVFDSVRIVARVREEPSRPDGAVQVNGHRVDVHPVPYYVGPSEFLLQRGAVRRAIHASAEESDAIILRAPSPLGSILARYCESRGRPYAVEVVGDPHEVFAPGVVRHPLRPVIRRWSTSRLRHQCRTASAVSYVTERALQRRYPHRPGCGWKVSDVELNATAFAAQPRAVVRSPRKPTLISVGALDQMYKGIDILIKALAELIPAGIPAHLIHIGTGRHIDSLRALAQHHGITHAVTFVGALPPGEPIRHYLDLADLFVMPSRTEGLPRALVEAMARALPAVGTAVGGIPELLAPNFLVPPDDAPALVSVIRQTLADPRSLAGASSDNLVRAHDFRADVLADRRADFYQAVRDSARRAEALTTADR